VTSIIVAACPHTRILHAYGPTETTTVATAMAVPDAGRMPARVPIGRPMDNTAGYVVDECLRPVPTGVTGELYLAGWSSAMLALYRSGRQAEALRAFGRLTRVLDSELGVAPSRPLRVLHRMVLAADPALDAAVAVPGVLDLGAAGYSAG
jgi:non-ribosomal peptide synthetase component F